MNNQPTIRRFNIGGRAVAVTHVWRTNCRARGARRFTYVYRVCQVVGRDEAAGTLTIQLVGLKSAPKKIVRADEVLALPPKPEPIPYLGAMCE